MSKSLIIVESNAKIKTISKFLGKDFKVLSSVGHIKDLPKQRLGVKIDEAFEPEYITIRGKGKVVSQLRKAASNADKIYIATDPDREGEAIAAHLAEEMKVNGDKVERVMFNEITEKAVRSALTQPTKINSEKVAAQKARRVVDRLVGYQVSPILWRTVYRGLSAGRVQSVALRLICERESEITSFVPEEYWSITAQLQGEKTEPFAAKLAQVDGKKTALKNEKDTLATTEDIRKQQFKIEEIRRKTIKRNPSPPFTTSTMQQAAANRLGYSSKKIMMIAQQLYEGIELGEQGSVGLITYMRTDSTRISEDAINSVREHISTAYGSDYLPASPRRFKVKAGAQDAHEAIRPTALQNEPGKVKRFLTKEQFRIYELIWNRFVASQMQPAKIEQLTIDISAGSRYLFRATGSTVVFPGFLQVYQDYSENNTEDKVVIPKHLNKDDLLKLLELLPEQHFTKPPARFTESSLIKELDALGIGRPSTYAAIISTILTRKYVDREKRQLKPTELGTAVNKILIQNFPDLFNVEFTANMEADLDKIESGDKLFLDVAESFYRPFEKSLEDVSSRQNEIRVAMQEQTGEKCEQCGRDLIIRWGRNGKFMACSGYPDCKYTKPLEAPEVINEKCDQCGSPMVLKHGRFGRFLACSSYPECKNTKPYSIGVDCPKDGCDGTVVEKKSKRGRVFYGCSNYPKCKFATWNRPVAVSCDHCPSPYLEMRQSQARGEHFVCPSCKSVFSLEEKEPSRAVAYG